MFNQKIGISLLPVTPYTKGYFRSSNQVLIDSAFKIDPIGHQFLLKKNEA